MSMKTLAPALVVASAAALLAVATADAQAGPGGDPARTVGDRSGAFHGGTQRGGGYQRGGRQFDRHPRGWGHRHHWHPGGFRAGFGWGVGLGAIAYPGRVYARPYDGDVGYVVDGGYGYAGGYESVAVPFVLPRTGRPVPLVTRAPDPIFYPNLGQGSATIESDRRECNRWATTQPGALADASIFQRATLACMEGRGYTVR
jgi:hypothetical protein